MNTPIYNICVPDNNTFRSPKKAISNKLIFKTIY